MNQRNKKMTKRDNSTEKIKQKVPDFSGKYHGKLNDKKSQLM